MDTIGDPRMEFTQDLVVTLRREVAQKEAELATLVAHKANLLAAFSMPTFPSGYGPSGAVSEEPGEPSTRQQSQSKRKPGSKADVPGKSRKREIKTNRVAVVGQSSRPSRLLSPTGKNRPAEVDRTLTQAMETSSGKAEQIRLPSRSLSPRKSDSPPEKARSGKPRKSNNLPPLVEQSRLPVEKARPPKRKMTGFPSPTVEPNRMVSGSSLSTDNDSPAERVAPSHESSPVQDRSPVGNVGSKSEKLDDAHQLVDLPFTPRSSRGHLMKKTTNEDTTSLQAGMSDFSSESSEDKTQLNRVSDTAVDAMKFSVVDWTQQIRKRSAASLNGDSSSESDSISSDSKTSKELSNPVEPTSAGKKLAKAARQGVKAVSQISSLPSDAPGEDLFDWEVLGLSGPWSQGKASSLLSESHWSQLQKRQVASPPCQFKSTDEYKSTFEGLIIRECKAQLEAEWDKLKSQEIPGASTINSKTQGLADGSGGPAKLWEFRRMDTGDDDPFTYIEAEARPSIRLDQSEIVLLTHSDQKVLAIVSFTHYKGALLRTRVQLKASSGQCTLERVTNVVSQKRSYISLSKVSEIWDPVQQQLLDPLVEMKSVINHSNGSSSEKEKKVCSYVNTLVAWKCQSKFNSWQLDAIQALLLLKQGFLLVQGPPGTGKTSTIVGMVSAVLIEEPRARILVCAASNAAVDEIVSRLMHHMINKDGTKYTPNRGALVRSGVDASIHEAYEAAQALESEVLIALQRVKGRCVMVGDPCQLPPVVIQRPAMPYGRSLFERMQEAGRPVYLMTTQYRMHPHISKFPSSQFYGGRLKNSSETETMTPIFTEEATVNGIDICGNNLKLGAYCFLDVTWGTEKGELAGHSLSNDEEATVVANVVQGIVRSLRKGVNPNIGVITPYLLQRSVIMNILAEDGVDEKACEVNTVDGFQGREKDVIVLSCVRAQTEHGLGFVSDVRRMNVALTRARHALIIVGHAGTLRCQSSAWSALLEDASSRDLYQLMYHKPKLNTSKVESIARMKNLDLQKEKGETRSGGFPNSNSGIRTSWGAKHTRFDEHTSPTVGTRIGTGHIPRPRAATGTLQGPNQTQGKSSTHLWFDEGDEQQGKDTTAKSSSHGGVPDAGTRLPLPHQDFEADSNSNHGSGGFGNRNMPGGLKRKAAQYENECKQDAKPTVQAKSLRRGDFWVEQPRQVRHDEIETGEEPDVDEFREDTGSVEPAPAPGRMRGQVDTWSACSWANERPEQDNRVTRQGHRYNGGAHQPNRWSADSDPHFGRDGSRIKDFGGRRGASRGNRGGGQSRGSGRKKHFKRPKSREPQYCQDPIFM